MMTSRLNPLPMTAVLLLLSPVLQGAAPKHKPQVEDYEHLWLATTLDAPGKPSFHLKVEFQLYDRQGVPTTTGTVEEWWSPLAGARIAIDTPTLKLPSANDVDRPASRDEELIYELLDTFVHPLPKLKNEKNYIFSQATRKAGSANLDCLFVQSAPHDLASSYCSEPGSTNLRMILSPDAMRIVRNRPGTFRDSSVALDVRLAYGPNDSISGKVTALQAIDAASTIADVRPETRIRLSVDSPPLETISGSKASFSSELRGRVVSGCAKLVILIGRDGRVQSLDTIYSADPALTQALTTPQRDAKYKPYLLDGQPVDVIQTSSLCAETSQTTSTF